LFCAGLLITRAYFKESLKLHKKAGSPRPKLKLSFYPVEILMAFLVISYKVTTTISFTLLKFILLILFLNFAKPQGPGQGPDPQGPGQGQIILIAQRFNGERA